MSLLGGNDSITVKMYYKYVDTKSGKQLLIIEDEKALKMLEDEKKAKTVDTLETKWEMLTWKEQNVVSTLSKSSETDPITGEKGFDYVKYRDSIVKKCLKSWNITEGEQVVPVTPDAIDKLPAPVVLDLFSKFNACMDFSEEELGK